MSFLGDMKLDGSTLGRRDELLVKAAYRALPPLRGESTRHGSSQDVMPQKVISELVYAELVGEQVEPEGRVTFRHRIERALRLLVSNGFVSELDNGYARSKGRRGLPKKEVGFYPALRQEIKRHWAVQEGREYHLRHRFLEVLDTHHGGRAKTGAWARPDITVVGGKILPYLPGKFVDVHTFEVKEWVPLIGIYEALAHRRCSHYSSVLFIWREEWDPIEPKAISTLVKEAANQGIGIMLLRQYDDYSQWEELLEPIRHEPDPQALNDFLRQQAGREGFGRKLQDWLQQPDHVVPPACEEDTEYLMFTTEEQNLAKRMIRELNDSKHELYSRIFPEYHESREMFDRVRYQLKNAGLIQAPRGKIRKANELLFQVRDRNGRGSDSGSTAPSMDTVNVADG